MTSIIVARPEPQPRSAGGQPRSKRRLILAQSDTAAEAEVRNQLTHAGFTVLGESGDADQVVAMATELRPDVAVMGPAPMNQEAQVAAALSGRKLAPVVMLADSTRPDQIRRALDAAVMGYVAGPFTAGRLVPAVELAIARHADAVALRDEISSWRFVWIRGKSWIGPRGC